MNQELNDLAAKAGVTWFDYQVEVLEAAAVTTTAAPRVCLYYKTGAGKSLTALACVALWGRLRCVVIAPPSTHQAWEEWGRKLGIEVETMSHAKFRQKDTKLSRTTAVIADEMHMFGGHKGQGWKKLSQLGRHLQAPLVMASATPNYNDADRVYCIESILDPGRTHGGYLEFVYRHCNTQQNPFSMEPLIDEDHPFRSFKDAADYLSALPGVFYLPDDLVYQIHDITYPEIRRWEMDVFGYDQRNHRMIASLMEERHTRRYQGLVNEEGLIESYIYSILEDIVGSATTPVLVYANHATVAEALAASLNVAGVTYTIVTGATSKKLKDGYINAFKQGRIDVLVGTASLATGTDGLDKMCDWLVILDDTDDDALRRQLIGRIMPRGSDTDASMKQVYRLLPDT